MAVFAHTLWSDYERPGIAEYALMAAVILVLAAGAVRFIGSNSNNAFPSVASSIR